MQQLRVGITGRNLLTFTKYSGWDPETVAPQLLDDPIDPTTFAGDSYGYPNFRTFTTTVQIVF